MMSLGVFRKVAIVEGLTTLALFFVAMPMKYLAGDPRLVPPVGMIHGVAFLVYLAVMVAAFAGRGVTASGWTRTTAASFFPFGTFINDGYLKSLEKRLSTRS